jgi:hypothetical protein
MNRTLSLAHSEQGPDGKPLSREAAIHKAHNRFNCRECNTVFCANCKTIPYHLGFTCEEVLCSAGVSFAALTLRQYQKSLVAAHCRFCDKVIQVHNCAFFF